MLEFRNTKLAVVEAKAWDVALTEGVAQAKNYAGKLSIRFTFATNGAGGARRPQPLAFPTVAEEFSLSVPTVDSCSNGFRGEGKKSRITNFQITKRTV